MLTNQENARIRTLENQILTMGEKLNAMYTKLFIIKNNAEIRSNQIQQTNVPTNNKRANNNSMNNNRTRLNNMNRSDFNSHGTMKTQLNYPNNQQKGRFLIRRWQNEYPGAMMDPRI